MHMTLLRLLVEEAMKGNKPSSTFKAGSFAFVVRRYLLNLGSSATPLM